MRINEKTGLNWSKILGLEVTNPLGWDSVEDYEKVPVDKNEYLLRCSNSVVTPPKNRTRRGMQEFRQNLLQK